MKSQTKSVTVFTSNDGKEFLSEVECKKHENMITEFLRELHFFICLDKPETDEHGTHQGKTVFIIYGSSSTKHIDKYYLKEYNGEFFDYVQGYTEVELWTKPGSITLEETQNIISNQKVNIVLLQVNKNNKQEKKQLNTGKLDLLKELCKINKNLSIEII